MISVESLTFSYKKGHRAIEDLSFHVDEGSIYGFLGANGSGKTTTIRLMLGLCRPEHGRVLIRGMEMNRPPRTVYGKIGAMIEQPSLYGHLTGEENLILSTLYHGVDRKEIGRTLSQVGLKYVASKRVSAYSMGMKQRLGLALCLLHNPELIVLDEPLNGLDPKGISEIRELLLTLVKKEGKTLFMSSHLLGEVESTCDAICVIDDGKKLFSGTIDELRFAMSGLTTWKIVCDQPEVALEQMNPELKGELHQTEKAILVHSSDKERIPFLIRNLVHADVQIYGVIPVESNLEQMYLKLTNG